MKKRKKYPGPSCDMEVDGDPKREGWSERFIRDMKIKPTCAAPGYVYRATKEMHLRGEDHNPEWCPICLGEDKR